MKRRFRVTVEGKSYEVEVEDIGEGRVEVSAPAPAPAPTPTAAPATAAPLTPKMPFVASQPPPGAVSAMPKPPPPPMEVVEGLVTAPMPGTVTSIKVKVGDQVKEGDVLLVLECMKILNDILSPKGGIVKEVFISEGAYVGTEERLVLVE